MGFGCFFLSFFYFQIFMEMTGNCQGSQVVAGHSEATCGDTKSFQVVRC